MSFTHDPRNSRRGSPAGDLSPLTDRVIFMDGEAIVLDKPAGLPVDRPRDGALSLENHLDSLTFGFQRWPVAVHRLDRDTSGCLLLARNPKAAKRFTQAFEAREVEKVYLAVLDGVPAEREGVIDLPLGKTSTREDGWRMQPDPKGKPAVTRWRLLEARDGRALVQFRPETGRTHQLRAHALHGLGLGILGDRYYPSAPPGAPWDGRMLLHAVSLKLPRPGKPPVEAEAPPPAPFAAAGFADAQALNRDAPSPAEG
ncbi:tRNA pseudouridine32 synthase/23S rRNA pseudouridine746 synthase [Sphingobium sp. B8D3C]|nr:tRNA pseudouridine32 synthase/23S rRNA pseudouridine746 synthase [Sphingobium sp. B8D3B]MCW2420294.1 tRNA pseudouridine32 synthase/23S rRNA pseudouridine746 synthase [Sphingobium sp. B8D3C]